MIMMPQKYHNKDNLDSYIAMSKYNDSLYFPLLETQPPFDTISNINEILSKQKIDEWIGISYHMYKSEII